jgi:hypothetical protein
MVLKIIQNKSTGTYIPDSRYEFGGVDLRQIAMFKHLCPTGVVNETSIELFEALAFAHGWSLRITIEEGIPSTPTPEDKETRQGWREFVCFECDHQFELPTRDYRSPSIETCPECSADCPPQACRPDASLAVDKMGNLLNPNIKQ